MASEFSVRCACKFRRLTGGKSRNLQDTYGGKGAASAAKQVPLGMCRRIVRYFPKHSIKAHAARQGRNPATGETVTIAAKKAPSFKAAKARKDAVE